MDLADKAMAVGQLWIEFRFDEDFSPFMKYNDLGCPLAHMISEGIVKEVTPLGEQMINETFKMLLDLLEVTLEEWSELEDRSLVSILDFANRKKQN